jgi:hypothetical protein
MKADLDYFLSPRGDVCSEIVSESSMIDVELSVHTIKFIARNRAGNTEGVPGEYV